MSEKQLLEETSDDVLEALMKIIEEEAEEAETQKAQQELKQRVG